MSNLFVFLGIVLLAHTHADHPLPYERDFPEVNFDFSVASRNAALYRLPQNVIPVEYDVYLDLYFDERTDRPYSYDGKVDIVIQAVEENVQQIVLHANVDTIHSVSLMRNNIPHPLNVANPVQIRPEYHFIIINLDEDLEVAVNYTLTIEYENEMNEGPMKRGIWRGWYIDDNGVERVYATTHFQPYNARQAFPCWDEPLFKAVFRLHISRPINYSGVFSNTGIEYIRLFENTRVQDNFFATPRMSSYLVTFLVSETFQVIAQDTTHNPPIRIIGRSNTVGMANRTLELTVKMTEFFDEYFEIPYSTLHPHLFNDHVSSPDWASAGTENWGMVSYRELYMITSPRETLMSVEHYSATLISHELAHKWFGNLITCYWWSNTWINEGFASYFGYIATNEVFGTYELDEHFNNRYLQTSLSFDSSVSTVPMNHEVNTPAEVTGHFGTISYSKAAAFLRMTVSMITKETFRKTCQYFLTDNAYEATNQTHLLNAFLKAISEDNTLSAYQHFNFTNYYNIWVNQPGYPILNVDIDHTTGDMSLSQERFFISSSATPTEQVTYPIPITYSTESSPTFGNLTPVYIMDVPNIVLTKNPGEEWVIFNNLQHGHYRVNYDERTWNLIADALYNNPNSTHYLNRAQIVDDVFALMRSGRMSYNFGFQILKFLRTEVNYHVWDPAISGYTWLRNRLRHLPEKQAEFDAFILSYLEHAIEYYGYETSSSESPTHTMTRQIILHFACQIGHEGCVRESRHRFVAYRNNQFVWVNIGVRRNVYVIGVKEGTDVDFEFMVNLANTTNYANDQLEMLRALGAAKDPLLLTRYLELTLTKFVRSHDKANSFTYALLGNQENANTVLQFVKNHIDEMRIAYVEDSPARPVHTCLSNLAAYLDGAGLQEYEAWLHSTQSDSAQYATAISAISSARANMQWGTTNADTVLAAARGGSTKVVMSLAMLLIMATLALVA
ncbi:membrane alanyl aminopeptidase-like isoform X2 [Pectinophora gossypiella]|uniref:membrane alanyl aminopeptidase-like isoform X2 n=1 Tax=Pectinophora gossypiella TaxID=13191 RepID=UPI00214EE26F|nr:membrane alanyl aminopeptidase-like isoform X2 [Pectinophora gossypiella]